MKQRNQPKGVPWKPGQSGNPAGRPLGARARISEKLLADLADVWETNGKAVLTKLVADDPGKLATIAYGLLPRDVFITVDQRAPGNLDPDEWAALRQVIDDVQEAKAGGLGPLKVSEIIKDALRAELAKPINGN